MKNNKWIENMECPICENKMIPTVYEHDGKEYVLKYTCHLCHIVINVESEELNGK